MSLKIVVSLICLALSAQISGQLNGADMEAQERAAADLRARIEASPNLPFHGCAFRQQAAPIGSISSKSPLESSGSRSYN
jgi:hypothetical protein